MSGLRVITWGRLRDVCERKGIEVRSRGSEAILLQIAPDGRRIAHVLSHLCCRSKSSVVFSQHLAAIKRKFGLTHEDLRSS